MASELRKKTQTAIDALRESNETCSLALLIDGDTGLVLCKSSDAVIPQNKLDDLATGAQDQRKNSLALAMTESASNPDLMSWIQIEKDSITAVIRRGQDSDDALICQFKDMPDRTALLNSARTIFDLATDAEAA